MRNIRNGEEKLALGGNPSSAIAVRRNCLIAARKNQLHLGHDRESGVLLVLVFQAPRFVGGWLYCAAL